MSINPTCCALFSLGHKTNINTASCGRNQTNSEKEQRRLMATKKAGGSKKGGKKGGSKGGGSKKGGAKKGSKKR
jgi:hypothetical protein